jgi:hypothetical protein
MRITFCSRASICFPPGIPKKPGWPCSARRFSVFRIAYTTRQRLHEIGIRVALGATRRGVFDLVLRHGLRITAIGIALGLLCSLLLTPLLRGQFYGVAPYDPFTYLCVEAALCVVALAACSLPAQRAAQVDPNRALRYESGAAISLLALAGPSRKAVWVSIQACRPPAITTVSWSAAFWSAGPA